MDLLNSQTLILIAAGLFLPLFPMTMVFNAVFQRAHNVWARVLLLLVWPLPGIWLLTHVDSVPGWVAVWALSSAMLYAFRAIVVREAGIWTGFLATSAWSLIWIAYGIAVQSSGNTGTTAVEVTLPQIIFLEAVAFSLPLMLMALLVSEIEKRYESAYAGIVSGIVQAQPRLSGLLVIATLAVIGSPMFPAFFSMLHNITGAISTQPMLAAGVAVVWFIWSWSAIRLLQELLVGQATVVRSDDVGHLDMSRQDLNMGAVTMYGAALVMLIGAGIYIAGVML